jgi:hypothetical protein
LSVGAPPCGGSRRAEARRGSRRITHCSRYVATTRRLKALYPEARAALAAATRAGRVGDVEYLHARELLEELWRAADRLGTRTSLAHRAGDLAEEHALIGDDAVHLASFETIASDGAPLVAFDEGLRRAALAIGFAIAPQPA